MRKVASSFKYKMAQAICLVRKTELYTDIFICILKPVHKIAKAKRHQTLELSRFLTEVGTKVEEKKPCFAPKETDLSCKKSCID